MATGSNIVYFLAQGTAAARPAAPDAQTSTLSFYFATDTEVLSFYDWNDAAWQNVNTQSNTGALNFVLDGGGSALTTGVKIDLGPWPFDLTLTSVTLLGDQTGSIALDLWVDTYANYPPTVADTITAAAKPTISAATKSQDNTLTGWTVAVATGKTIRVNIDSITTLTRCGVSLAYTR